MRKLILLVVLSSLIFLGNLLPSRAQSDMVCPEGDAKYEWKGETWVKEYGEDFGVGGNARTVTWTPFVGSVCLKKSTMTVSVDGMAGSATTTDHDWSHLVLTRADATATPTSTAIPTATPTATATTSATPSNTPTFTPTIPPCCCPTPTPTELPTSTPTLSPTPTPTPTESPIITPTPTPTPADNSGTGGTSDSGGGNPGPEVCTDTIPNAPYLRTASVIGENSVQLVWDPVADPVTGYSLFYGPSCGDWRYSVVDTGKVTAYTVEGLNSGCFQVRAKNGCAIGDPSNSVTTGSVLGSSTGQVLGASTLPATGSLAENVMNLVFAAGSFLSALGFKKKALH